MFAFRKFFLTLALVATFGTIASAQGPGPVNCVANSGVPPLLRAEGLAELVGDVLIECRGGDPTETRFVNFDIFLNTNITSDVVGNAAEGMILVDEPTPAEQTGFATPGAGLPLTAGRTPAIYRGLRTAGFENRLTWNGVAFTPPGTNNVRRFRITNVRANATQLPTGQFVPSSVSMFINVSPQNSLPLDNPQQIVGTILPSLRVTVGPASFKKCEPPANTFSVTLTELFATAFKKRIESSTDEFGAVVKQNQPGFIYHTESGFIPNFLSDLDSIPNPTNSNDPGVADTGTRFVITFAAVPSGVGISAPNLINVGGAPTNQFGLARVTGWNSDFSGGALATTGGTGTIGLTSGGGTMVYEVVGDPGVNRSSFIDSITVVFNGSFPTNVGLGDATVSVSYGPINETATMSTVAPEPRFTNRDADQNNNIFGVRACRTLILWPFVSNQGGFDTGLAISNTSTDPFGTAPQAGPCTLYYYGNTNGTGAAPAAQTSASIPSGDHLVTTLSSGGKFGVREVPGFQGYVIAVCEFQYAHAYGFISDLGAQRLAQGYLALIIPDKAIPVRRAEAFSLNQDVNQGEQLVH